MISSKPKSILMPIYNGTYFNSALKLAEAIGNSTEIHFIFLFGRSYPGLEQHIESVQGRFRYYLLNQRSLPMPGEQNKINHSRKFGFEYLLGKWKKSCLISARRIRTFDELLDFMEYYLKWRVLKAALKTISERENIALYLLPADNRYQYSQITKIARESQKPIIVAPQWFAGPCEIEQSLSHLKQYRPNKLQILLLRIIAPGYLRLISFKSEKFFIIPVRVSEILLSKILKIVPPMPWILHSGFADRILVETVETYNFASRLGFSPSQLKLVGSVHLDEINSLIEGRTLDINLLVAVAPDMFASRNEYSLEFHNYQDYLTYLCETFSRFGFHNVLFSMHPSDSGIYHKLIESYGFSIAKEEIHKLLPRVKLFVATISATIQWSNYLHTPTINFDFYQYNYPDYLDRIDYPLVELVCSRANFESALHRFSTDKLFEVNHQTVQDKLEQKKSNRHVNLILEEIEAQIERCSETES